MELDLLNQERKVLLITGKTGSGKTRITKKLRNQWSRSITLDTMNYEYDGTILRTMEDVFNFAIDEKLEDEETPFKIALRLSSDFDQSEVKACFSLVERLGNMLLVVEESSIYFDHLHPIEQFQRLVSQGRHFNVSLICVSQRVPELDTTFRAQANSVITFLQTSPTDLEGLRKWGFDIEQVKALEKFDARYSIPYLGINYLCDGEPLSTYGVKVVERDTTQHVEETDANDTENLSQRQTESTQES